MVGDRGIIIFRLLVFDGKSASESKETAHCILQREPSIGMECQETDCKSAAIWIAVLVSISTVDWDTSDVTGIGQEMYKEMELGVI